MAALKSTKRRGHKPVNVCPYAAAAGAGQPVCHDDTSVGLKEYMEVKFTGLEEKIEVLRSEFQQTVVAQNDRIERVEEKTDETIRKVGETETRFKTIAGVASGVAAVFGAGVAEGFRFLFTRHA